MFTKQNMDKEDTMLPSSLGKTSIQSALPIAESHPQNKKTISNGKSNLCGNDFLVMKLSETLGADSTITVKGLNPYWEESLTEKNLKLWLPTETVLQDLGMNLSNTLLSKTVENSWFSVKKLSTPQNENSQKTYLQSCMSSLVECMDLEDMSLKSSLKSKKIRFYPTKEQKIILKKWISGSRAAYNKTIEFLKQPNTKANWKGIKTGIIKSLPDYCNDVPYQIKSLAIRDACKAVSNAKKKYKNTSLINRVRFRSKKTPYQSMFIPKSGFSKKIIGFYIESLGEMKFSQKMPSELKDSRCVYYHNRWYICIPTNMQLALCSSQTKGAENQGRLVACDPGIRTFLSFYSENSCGKLGEGDFGRIQRLCYWLDNLISRISKATGTKKYRMRKAANRIRVKINNLIDEIHHKIALFLCKNFDIILMPTFETAKMSKRSSRKITAKSVRSMLSFAHYRFKKFLKHKAFELGKIVIDVNEAFTSKTRSWNGIIDSKLGGKKYIKDENVVVDRDINGARGIFLRALVDSPLLIKVQHAFVETVA